MSFVNIDGRTLNVKVYAGNQPMVINHDKEWYVFQSSRSAGKAAREYWEDMAKEDSVEFVYIVGQHTLVQWALGNYAGPGTTKVTSLNKWLDLWLDIPEKQWARYDGNEIEGVLSKEAMIELGFDHKNVVFYRNN